VSSRKDKTKVTRSSPRVAVRLVPALIASALLAAPAARAQPEPAPPPDRSTPPLTERELEQTREEAHAHFEKGVAYRKNEQWGAALTEFLKARELYPEAWPSTSNAVVCLQKLQRYDEALDLLESLLRDHATSLSKEAKEAAERRLAEVEALVSTVDIRGAAEGAAVVINGRYRGTFPLRAPLRLGPGHHEIRAYKEGSDPLGGSVDVEGRQAASVTLTSLSTGGRLRVTEQRGRVLDVVVDGAVVGKTPWDGTVAVGEHVVLLRGRIDLDDVSVCAQGELVSKPSALISAPLTSVELGTQPVRVPVRWRELSPLTLTAEALDTWIRIEPEPAGSTVSIDSEVVGRGTWEGRLRVGEHKVEVAAEGFVPETRLVSLVSRKRTQIKIALGRDPLSALWQRPGSLIPAGVAYGAGATGLVVFGVTGILALNKITDVRSRCESTLCPTSEADNIDAARKLGTAATIGLVVGGVGLAAGTLLLFKRPGGGPSAAKASSARVPRAEGVHLEIGVGLGQARIDGRF
jgi:hypothetical protein